MPQFEQTIIIGNLGKDAISRNNTAEFNVAVNQGKTQSGEELPPVWYKCVVSGPASAICATLKAGTTITVIGKVRSQAWTKDGRMFSSLILHSQQVIFSGKRNGTGGYDDNSAEPDMEGDWDMGYSTDRQDDNIPF